MFDLHSLPVREIDDIPTLETHLRRHSLSNVVVQGLDLRGFEKRLKDIDVAGTTFLGCKLPVAAIAELVTKGAVVFPELPGELPFQPYRSRLYSPLELFDQFDPDDPLTYCACLDARVYRHWQATGGSRPPSILETLARRLHDHAMTDALEEALAHREGVVAIMGGHSMLRTDESYRAIATISREMTRKGMYMVSGGGPGAMEAAHLGAWFASYDDGDLGEAIEILAEAPSYRDLRWLAQAFLVRRRWVQKDDARGSLGIPTWLYGHEPPNAFATLIAKYFANSAREDGLVTIATSGIVFAPGSAGTIQEIFQDATQNHYGTVGFLSPMVFYGVDYWTNEKPVIPLLRKLSEGSHYGKMIAVTDDPETVTAFIMEHPPVPSAERDWSFCRAFGRG